MELDTEQIPNIFEVKLNTDGTILSVLQNESHTRKIRESINSYKNINVEDIVLTLILILNKYELFKASNCNYT